MVNFVDSVCEIMITQIAVYFRETTLAFVFLYILFNTIVYISF